MRILKCNRCGKVDYEVRCARDYHIYNGTLPPRDFRGPGIYIDLCDDCYKDFVAWLDGEKRAPETGKSFDCSEKAVKSAKAEAYKEFAEKLKQHKRKRLWNSAVLVEDIDNVLGEMVGEEK